MKKIFALLTWSFLLSTAHADCEVIPSSENVQKYEDQKYTSSLIGPLLHSSDSMANKYQACALVRYLEADMKLVLCSSQRLHKDPNDGWYNVIRNKSAALAYSKPISDYCSGHGDLQKARDTYNGTPETDGFPAYEPLFWE